MCFFQVYQYVTPIVVLPLSYFAWLKWYDRERGSLLWASTAKCTDRRLGSIPGWSGGLSVAALKGPGGYNLAIFLCP